MDIYKIAAVVEHYRKQLADEGVPRRRIDIDRSFGDCTKDELLAHAHYLASNMQTFMYDTDKFGKANRHLSAIQMCLSFAGRYTLSELMNHNMPAPEFADTPMEPERPSRSHDDLYKNPFRR